MRLFLPILSAIALTGCAEFSFGEPPSPAAPVLSVTKSPLQGLTRLQLPEAVHTVRQAAQYLLKPTGYSLVLQCPACPPEATEIGAKPISPLGLRPQLTTIERALILVAGSRTRLVIDDEAREVCLAYMETN